MIPYKSVILYISASQFRFNPPYTLFTIYFIPVPYSAAWGILVSEIKTVFN